MLLRPKRLSLLDITLNLVFGAWLLYFIATGYVIPAPLLRHASHPPVAEIQQTDPAPNLVPLELPDQDS